jgi:hypothetical protein
MWKGEKKNGKLQFGRSLTPKEEMKNIIQSQQGKNISNADLLKRIEALEKAVLGE